MSAPGDSFYALLSDLFSFFSTTLIMEREKDLLRGVIVSCLWPQQKQKTTTTTKKKGGGGTDPVHMVKTTCAADTQTH